MSDIKPKEKDVSQVVRYLTNTFKTVTAGLEPASRTKDGANKTYRLQSDFAYLINEITQGPSCMVQKYITDCNEFLDGIIKQNNQA